MTDAWAGVTPERLLGGIETGQKDLEKLVVDRKRMRRDIGERDAVRMSYDLAIYAANARVETFALLLGRMNVPEAQHVWDRHLIVYLHAALHAYPILAGKVIREFTRLHKAGSVAVDLDKVKAEHKTYKAGNRDITADREFIDLLDRVRNTVGAHHLTPGDQNIDGLVDSVQRSRDSGPASSDPLVINTIKWSMRATRFGQSTLDALLWRNMPSIPAGPEYRRLVRELDARELKESSSSADQADGSHA